VIDVQNSLTQLASSIRLADVLDIVVIALLSYCTLLWLRQRASKSLVVGVASVVGLFLVARWLDMYLTTMLFQAGFMAMLLTLIVVFQQDIRRAFERLAVSGFFARSPESRSVEGVVDVLVETIVNLAQHNTGALLVFEGREPLERHLRGGVAVNAQISLPLLCSIFNPQSPGHDGAVVIDNDRIDKLGVHLPLSKNLTAIGNGGTRHAAALGLAEQCDAIVIVVSEERGTISVAEHDKLREVRPAELVSRLRQYYENHAEPHTKSPWYAGITRDIEFKLAAIGLACACWLLFAYRVETIQRTYVVPIEYRNLPESWVIDEPRRTSAELTLTGSERGFDQLDASSLSVSFDLSHVQLATPYSFDVDQSLKGVPSELSVNQVQPESVRLQVRRKPTTPSEPKP